MEVIQDGLVKIDFCVTLGNTSHGNRPREDRHSLSYLSFNLNTCTKVLAYAQHDQAIARLLPLLYLQCIKQGT